MKTPTTIKRENDDNIIVNHEPGRGLQYCASKVVMRTLNCPIYSFPRVGWDQLWAEMAEGTQSLVKDQKKEKQRNQNRSKQEKKKMSLRTVITNRKKTAISSWGKRKGRDETQNFYHK